jgi:hypothetical protein
MSDLNHRFVCGPNDLSWYTPFTPQSNFFLGLPRATQQLAQLGQKQIEFQRQVLTRFEGPQSLSAEFNYQMQCLERGVTGSLSDVQETIRYLEDSLNLNLTEIKVVLGQINDKLAEISYLTKYRRMTEAQELVLDGAKALSRGYFDEAEKRLKKAIDRKFACFPAHTNLGFVYLHEGKGEAAIEQFKIAVDYATDWAPDKPEVQINAMETLARAYYAVQGDGYQKAAEVSKVAQELRNLCKFYSPLSKYRHLVYCFLAWPWHRCKESGRKSEEIDARLADFRDEVFKFCLSHPNFFPIAVTDKDIDEVVRKQIAESYIAVAQSTYSKAVSCYEKVKPEVLKHDLNGTVEKKFPNQPNRWWEEIARRTKENLDALLERSVYVGELLQRHEYSASLSVLQLSSQIRTAFEILKELLALEFCLSQTKEDLEKAQREFENLKKRNEEKSKAVNLLLITIQIIIGAGFVGGVCGVFARSISKRPFVGLAVAVAAFIVFAIGTWVDRKDFFGEPRHSSEVKVVKWAEWRVEGLQVKVKKLSGEVRDKDEALRALIKELQETTTARSDILK